MHKTFLSLTPLLLLFVFLSCQKERSFEIGAPGAGALLDAAGDCSPKTIGGTYVAGRALTDSNFIDVGVFVTKKGAYTISAPAQNGFSFRGTGNFSDTGLVMVRLKGTGTPTTAGTNSFTITYDSSACAVSITVLPAGSTGGGTSGTCSAMVNGSYVTGSALGSTNNVSLQHTYTTAGTYTVTTDTVNGYSFKKVVTAAAGTPTAILLDGAGTPLTVGTNRFKLKFGTANAADTCGFEVTVNAPAPSQSANTYYPLTQNSKWGYDDPTGSGDTSLTIVSGTATLNSKTYSQFINTYSTGGSDSAYFRKETSNNYFYQYLDLDDIFAGQITFTQPKVEINFLRETLATGTSWDNIFTGSVTGVPVPVSINFKFTCVNANATVTYNGQTFNNVYHIKLEVQSGAGGMFTTAGQTDFYYAKGVGLINIAIYNISTPPPVVEDEFRIRTFQVF